MVVTSPSPSASAAPPAAAPGRPHPTYTNMITYALAQLGGASGRSAIAGFIAACFTGLPVSHDALLSAHLRRLVAEGVLCTSGFSYFFSSDEPIDSATRSLDLDSDDQSGSGFIHQSSSDDDNDDAAYTPLMHVPTSLSLLGEKRGRGRPRKNVEVSPAKAGGVRRGRGRPRKVVVMLSGSGESMSPQPFAAKGEPTEHSVLSGDAVTKRGRGRPRKKLQQVGDPSTGGGGGGGGGGGIIIKRGPTKEEDQQSQEAKPPPTPTALSTGGVKTEQQSEEEEAAAEHPPTPLSTGDATPAPETGAATPAEETGGAASTGIKRGRGRPRKEKPAAAAMSAQAGDAGTAGIKRGRGRPRKEKPAAAMLAETEAGDAVSTGMNGALENPISVYAVSTGTNGALENPRTEAGGIVSMVMKRGRGRPRKEQPAFD